MGLTLDQFQLYPTTTLLDGDLELRTWYANGRSSFLSVDGETVQTGNGSSGFYIAADCSIASQIITVPATDIFTTLDAQTASPQSIQVFGRLFQRNAPKQWVFSSWVIPGKNSYPGGVITFEQLTIWNEGNIIVNPPDTYWTQQEIVNYFNTLSPAPDASALVKGVTKLSIAPVSAVNPIAVGDNDPRIKFMPDILAVGTFTLVAGTTVTVTPVPTIATDSPILVVPAANGITGTLRWTNRVAATSFDVFSDEGGDAGLFMYFIFAQP